MSVVVTDLKAREGVSAVSIPLRLLLVEDLEDDALLLIRELRRHGFKPYWQRVVSEVELRTSLSGNEWDIVLSDYSLPGFSGMAVLALVQEADLDIPVIIVSGTIDEERAVTALKAGARDFIVKSAMARLVPAIQRELREAAARRQRRMAEERLQQSERYFRALIERAADLIVVLAEDGLVHDVSPAVTRMLGYRREELIGQSVRGLVHPDDRRAASAFLDALAVEPNHSLNITLRAFHTDGSMRSLEIIATNLLADPAVAGIVINARDVTRQTEAEAQIRLQAARAESLVRVAARLNAHLDRGTVISAICEETVRALGADLACVILPGPGGANQIVGAAGPGVAVLGQLAPAMPTILARLLAGQGPVVVVAPGSTSRQLDWCALGAQMVRDGQPVGTLVIAFANSSRPISADDRTLLGGLADQAGLALDNADLLAELQASNEALEAAYDATLEGWVHALDLRDKETEGHTRRVTAMTLRLARTMGFDEEALTQIYRGALLHDIGKLGIPDRILHKAAALDDAEWELMRMHPVYAYEWLRPIPFLRPALDIPYCHHERWDGKGYPRGLSGKEIPLTARIDALVDSWDALRSERPYKPAYPQHHALQLIREQSGRHFDPDVIEVFLQMLPELGEAAEG
jgi:PAS domain S-box-containing protein